MYINYYIVIYIKFIYYYLFNLLFIIIYKKIIKFRFYYLTVSCLSDMPRFVIIHQSSILRFATYAL